MSDAIDVNVVVIAGRGIRAIAPHDRVARDLGSVLTVTTWAVEVGELLRRAGELRVIMIDVLAILLSLKLQTVLVYGNHGGFKRLRREGLGHEGSETSEWIWGVALSLSSVLLGKLTHRGGSINNSIHDYGESGSRQPVACGSGRVCQSGWTGDLSSSRAMICINSWSLVDSHSAYCTDKSAWVCRTTSWCACLGLTAGRYVDSNIGSICSNSKVNALDEISNSFSKMTQNEYAHKSACHRID
jgi:hypothetical protein